MTNYIQEYYNAIQSGEVVVGKWVRLLYEKILDGIEIGKYKFSPKKANKAIVFIETFAHHHEGALAPGLIKLELWQKAYISVLFGVLDQDGNRQFRESVLVMGRKNGKTLLDASISEYMMFADGEHGARIYYIAPKLQQANLCYDAFYQMVGQEPELSRLAKKRRTDIYIEATNSSAQPLAFSQKKSDGLNPSFVSCDEIASWIGEAGLKQYEVLKSAFGARKQGLLLSISTAGYESEGIYDELIRRSTRFLLGDSSEERLLPVLYMIDDLEKWNDKNELRKANPNMDVSVSWEYLKEEIAIAMQSESKRREFMTKYANIKQNSSCAWLATQDVESSFCDMKLDDFAESYCVGGIDLSRAYDLSACCVVIEKNKDLYVFAKFFLPAKQIEFAKARDGLPYDIYIKRGLLQVSGENAVDYNDCYLWFKHLVDDLHIYPLQVGYDRYSATYLVQQMIQSKFHMDDVNQGFNLTGTITETECRFKDHTIHICSNELMKVHLLDSALQTDNDVNKRTLVKLHKNAHVDGCAALLDAMCMRQKYYGEYGVMLANED